MTRQTVLRMGALALVVACAPAGPQAILYGVDICSYCKMQIAERRFAAEVVTKHGRSLKFDSIECLLAYLQDSAARANAASMWVSNFRNPGALIDATTARFVDLGPSRAPMGRGLAAVASARDAAAIGVIDVSMIKRWTDLL